MRIIGPDLQRQAECEAILRSLPEWFGIEESLRMYVDDSGSRPTYALEENGRLIAFLTLDSHFPWASEVHCLAVKRDARNRGLGSELLRHTETALANEGVRFLQVKTLAPSNPDPFYAQTREFYRRRGFVELEIFPLLWSPSNPALQLVKALNADSQRG